MEDHEFQKKMLDGLEYLKGQSVATRTEVRSMHADLLMQIQADHLAAMNRIDENARDHMAQLNRNMERFINAQRLRSNMTDERLDRLEGKE